MMLTRRIAIGIVTLAMALMVTTGGAFAQGSKSSENPFAGTPLEGLSPYATARFNVGAMTSDRGDFGDKATEQTFGEIGSAQIGFDLNRDNLSAGFRIWYHNSSSHRNQGTNLEKFWIEADYGKLKVMLGHRDTPYTNWSDETNYDWNAHAGYGATWDKTSAQIMVSYEGFYFDLIPTYVPASTYQIATDEPSDAYIASATGRTPRKTIPKMAAGYDFGAPNYGFGLGAAFNTYEFDSDDWTDGESITSYLLYARANAKVNTLYGKANFGYHQNGRNFGFNNFAYGQCNLSAQLNDAEQEIENTSAFEGYAQLGNDFGKFSVEAGYGYMESDNDLFSQKDKAQAYFLQGVIPIDKHLTVYPSWGIEDNMRDFVDRAQTKLTFFNVFVVMNI